MNHTYPPLTVLYIASVVRRRIGTPDYAESLKYLRTYKGDCGEIDCRNCVFAEGDRVCAAHIGMRGVELVRYTPSDIRRHVLRILKEKP